MALAGDVTALHVECQFELGPGLARIVSRGRVPVRVDREEEQVLELDCGTWQH